MKRKIITITGDIASGKSTVTEELVKRLGYERYSNGKYFRKLAIEYGMDVTSFGKYVEKHPEIDKSIEEKTKEYALNHDELIIDARLGFYSVPDSFKVYLKVDLDVGAKRAFEDSKRKDTENFSSIEMQKKDIETRYELENKRYKNIYGVDRSDLSQYDLVVDTTDKTYEETTELILDKYNDWISN